MNSIPGYMFCIPANQLVRVTGADSTFHIKRGGEEIRTRWVPSSPNGPALLHPSLPVSPPVSPPVLVPRGKERTIPIIHSTVNFNKWSNG